MNKTNKVHNVIICNGNSRDANEWSSRLRTQGYAVEVATGGFHALNLMEKDHFDIMLLAENMEDMSSFEVLSMTKSTENTKSIPIVYVTPEETEQNTNQAVDLGANAVVVKSNGYFNNIVKKMKELI